MTWNTSVAARILRVNHGGEHGAICIYSAQIAAARFRAPDLLPFLNEALAHERDHRARFRSLMPSRQGKPCRMMWIWAVGGAGLGLISGVLGREAILACTEAVERTVHRHLDDQIRWTSSRDHELRSTIEAIQIEEQEHIRHAVSHRRGRDFAWLESAIAHATEALIWLSTRGDSTRLARQLAPDAAV